MHSLRYIKPASSFRSTFAYSNMMYLVAGEVIKAVGGRAIELYMDPATGYQRAVTLYALVDSASTFAGSFRPGALSTPELMSRA